MGIPTEILRRMRAVSNDEADKKNPRIPGTLRALSAAEKPHAEKVAELQLGEAAVRRADEGRTLAEASIAAWTGKLSNISAGVILGTTEEDEESAALFEIEQSTRIANRYIRAKPILLARVDAARRAVASAANRVQELRDLLERQRDEAREEIAREGL